MKTSRKAAAFLLCLIGLLSALSAPAASLSLTVSRSDTIVADAMYPGTGSFVFSATDPGSGLSAAVAGRNYGVNPSPGQPRWGLQHGNGNSNAFIVTNGFAPAAAGSQNTSTGTAASYISITFGNVQPNTMFQNLSIEFSGVGFVRITNPWAAASVGGFSNWMTVTQSNPNSNNRTLSAALPDFTWSGGEPLEIRLYGVNGDDEGRFSSVRITGNVMLMPQVPEPATAAFGIIVATWLTRRRRQKFGAVA